MSRRARSAHALLVVSALATVGVAGCGSPTATKGLGYADLDATGLEDVAMVVAASRSDTTHYRMRGSTLLVDAKGEVRRLDNEGMDDVVLAYDGSVVAFSDHGHDYLLGTDRPMRPRGKVEASSAYASYLHGSRLVSLFNGGFGEEAYDLEIAESDRGVRLDQGYVAATAHCTDGIWALTDPDVEGVSLGPRVEVRRISPPLKRSWSIDASGDVRRVESLGLDTATCADQRVIAVGSVTDKAEVSHGVVATVNVMTGRARLVDLDRQGQSPTKDLGIFKAAAIDRDDLVVVEVPGDGSIDVASIRRINPRTGNDVLLRKLKGSDRSSELLYRFRTTCSTCST